MRGVVIFLVGLARGTSTQYDEQYVVAYRAALDDPDWLTTTADITKAKVFTDLAEATAYWRQPVPGVVRWDGKAERPLTAFTISFEPVEYDG